MFVTFSDYSTHPINDDRDLLPLINSRLNSRRFSNFDVSDDVGELGVAHWTVDGAQGDWSTDQLVELHIAGHELVLHYAGWKWVCHKDDEGELWGAVPAVAPSRTPSDILLLPEEEALLVLDHDADCRWWLILENGELEDIFAQQEARPADATACGGDWYMPWYNVRNHVHGGDRGRLSWAAHMYGTRAAVHAVHAMVLKRVRAGGS
jgi:hypothetical protein